MRFDSFTRTKNGIPPLTPAALALLAFLGASDSADASRVLSGNRMQHSTHEIGFSEDALLKSVMNKTLDFLRSKSLKESVEYRLLRLNYFKKDTKGLKGKVLRKQTRENRARFRKDRQIFLQTLNDFFSAVHTMHTIDRSLIHSAVGVDGTAKKDFLDILTFALRGDPLKNKGTTLLTDECMKLWGGIFDAVILHLRKSVRERIPSDVASAAHSTSPKRQGEPEDNRKRD